MRRLTSQGNNYLLQVPVMLLIILALASVSTSIKAFGQGGATILGTVTDPTGAVVPHARITLTNTATGFSRATESNETGNYSAPELPVGQYEIRVEAAGFKTYEQKGVTLNVNTVVRADPKLEIGSVGQTVMVEANQLQIQVNTSDISQTITSQQIENLSTNGRNVLQLAALVPGASSTMPDFDIPAAQWQNRNIYFNGMRQDANNWKIDGGEAYDRGGGGILLVSPSQDAIGEFKVQTSNYAADQGNSSGGMTSMELKSGGKQFHGGAWEYNRNDAFDAYSYLSKQQANPTKPKLRYNAYGFNIGGPVQFKSSDPKTFFFYNMEWRKLIQGGSIFNEVPTKDNYAGNMTGLGTIYVPNTTDPNALAKFAAYGLKPGDPFPNNTIPAGLIDASAKAYLDAGYMLPPNTSDGKHYYSSADTITPYREELARVDHQFNDKIRLMGHFIYDSSQQQMPRVAWANNTYPTVGSVQQVPSWQGVVHLTHAISPTLLNEVSWDFNGNNITLGNTGLWKTPSGFKTQPLFADANTVGKVTGILLRSPYNVEMEISNWPWKNWWRSYTWRDDVSWMLGKHNLKLGFQYMYTNKKQQIFVNTAGTYTFNGNATAASLGGQGTPGVGLADFLLGFASNYSQAQLQDFVQIANNVYNFYGMDDWRISPRLTLNLGLRWEGLPHAYDVNNRLGNFYPYLYSSANTARFLPGTDGVLDTSGPGFTTVSGIALSNVPFYLNGVGLAGRNGVPRSLVTNHWNNIAPRLGFEYDLFGTGKTVLRGGGGVFYERNAGNEEYNMGANPPFSNSSSTNSPYLQTPSVSWVTGTGAGKSPTTPQGFTGVQANLPISTVYQYNLGIQHQLRSNMVMTLGYVGNSSSHLSQTVNINTVPENNPNRLYICGGNCGVNRGTDPTKYNANYNRRYVGFGNINLVEDQGNAHYTGIQTTFRATEFHNLSFDFAYTYSHAWDVIDGQLFNNLYNPMNPAYDYGTAGFDRRQIAVLNFNYDLPIFRTGSGAARNLLGGWSISGVSAMQTGVPLTINAANDNLGFGGNTTNRADQSGIIAYPKSFQHWFANNVFTQPAPLTWGNSAKSAVKGPGRQQWSLSLFKDFKFNERYGFQFRAAAFNAWNHTQFTGVNTSVLTGNASNPYNATAGQINAIADPRVFQFGAKVYF